MRFRLLLFAAISLLFAAAVPSSLAQGSPSEAAPVEAGQTFTAPVVEVTGESSAAVGVERPHGRPGRNVGRRQGLFGFRHATGSEAVLRAASTR